MFKEFCEESITFEDFTHNEENKAYEGYFQMSLPDSSMYDETHIYIALYFEDGRIIKAEISEKSEKSVGGKLYAYEKTT